MFQTQYSYKFDSAKHAEPKSELPSLTVPDMSYTVRELLEKFTSGGSLPPIDNQAEYEENPTFDDALSIDQDLTDLHQARRAVNKLQNDLLKLENLKKERQKEAQNKDAQQTIKELQNKLSLLDNSGVKKQANQLSKNPSQNDQENNVSTEHNK